MRILFLTTYNVTLDNEHCFTREVARALNNRVGGAADWDFIVGTMATEYRDADKINVIRMTGIDYRLIDVVGKDSEMQIQILMDFIRTNKIDIVHSNMIEGIDIEACRRLDIPIVNTIHIGGFMCPRGGGFLRYDDSICNEAIGPQCAKCMAKDMPFPKMTYALHRLTPSELKISLSKRLNRFVLYLTPFLRLTTEPIAKREFVKLANYSHIIAADNRLVDLLRINGIDGKVHMIPHGVNERRRLAMPDVYGNTPIKFYFLARAEYSKGLHIIIEALEGIPTDQYELHVIGDTSYLGKKSEKYFNKIRERARFLNVFFDGRIPNDRLEDAIKDYHVMIHSAIFLEVYGIAIAESLSMGRPVLATRCGGAEMQIVDGHNGWLINPNDVEDMRKAILHILANRNEIIEYGKNAKVPMPLGKYTEKLISLYTNIIQK